MGTSSRAFKLRSKKYPEAVTQGDERINPHLQVAPHRGLTPRESYLVHPRGDKQSRHAHHLLRGQQLRGLGEVYAVLGHTVEASQVAPLREGDAKIVVVSAE